LARSGAARTDIFRGVSPIRLVAQLRTGENRRETAMSVRAFPSYNRNIGTGSETKKGIYYKKGNTRTAAGRQKKKRKIILVF
jgi:hypothetical protein